MDALSSEGRSRKVFKPALLLVVLDLLDEGAVDPTRVAPDETIRALEGLLRTALE